MHVPRPYIPDDVTGVQLAVTADVIDTRANGIWPREVTARVETSTGTANPQISRHIQRQNRYRYLQFTISAQAPHTFTATMY